MQRATASIVCLVLGAMMSGALGRMVMQPTTYTFGLWGDLPYGDVQNKSGMPNLVKAMNAENLTFTVHDGDIKSGSSRCDTWQYSQFKFWLSQLNAPAIYTPGDNEWTDCDRTAAGAYNNRERLDYIRKQFFATSATAGKMRWNVEVQPDAMCLNAANATVKCLENRRWTYGKVTYVTLNVPGSCNNLCDTGADPEEFQARNAANIKWLQDSFANAKAKRSVAVMLITQANPGFDLSDGTRAPLRNPQTLVETDGLPDGYKDWLIAVRNQTVNFAKPVVYVHGDSHYFRIDRPMLNETGYRLKNFIRLETPGDNQQTGTTDVQWVKVMVNSNTREVFSFQPMLVPGN